MEKDNRFEVPDGTSRARPGVGHFGGTRVLLGPEGRAWTVHEAPAAHVPGARARQCLIFDTTGHCFRVWQYPIDWRELTSAELMALGGITPDD